MIISEKQKQKKKHQNHNKKRYKLYSQVIADVGCTRFGIIGEQPLFPFRSRFAPKMTSLPLLLQFQPATILCKLSGWRLEHILPDVHLGSHTCRSANNL